jgi:oligoendopeptidase F
MRKMILALALIASAVTAGAQSRDRAQTPDIFKWNLVEIYPSDAAWRTAKAKLAADLPALRQFQGSCVIGGTLADALEKQADFNKELSRDTHAQHARGSGHTRRRARRHAPGI